MTKYRYGFDSSISKNFKAGLDRIVDPLFFWGVSNAAGAYGGDQLLDYISKNTDTYEGLAMMGVYTGIGVAALAMNKWVIIPLAKKIANFQKEKYHSYNKKGLFSWTRTLAQFGATYSLYTQLNMANVVQNYEFDASRIIDAFSRSGKSAQLLADEQTVPSFKQFPQFKLATDDKQQITGMIEGRKMDGMFTLYTGISGVVPKKTNVDFKAQIEKMWRNKLSLTDDPQTKEIYDTQVAAYTNKNAKRTRMTFSNYLKEMQISTKTVKDNIDWHKVQELKGLNWSQTTLVRDISMRINEQDLMPYGLTELMPGMDGELNIGVADYILRNAGREYIELIPALGDKLPSFGLYQFTPYALYDDLKRSNEERGASIINLALPQNHRITNTVTKLSGNDHHKAAYMFAIHNLSELVSQLNRRQFAILQQNYASKMRDIAVFIATSHHLPRNAIACANQWLDDRVESTYSSHCDEKIRVYSRKTSANLAALYNGIEQEK